MGDLIEKVEEYYNKKIRIEFNWKDYNKYFVILRTNNEIIGSFNVSYDYKATLDNNFYDITNKINKYIIKYYLKEN